MTNEGFDPMKSLGQLRDSLGRLIEDGLTAVTGAQSLALDIYETETTVVVKAGPLAGIEPEGIDVTFTGDVLTIKGETHPDEQIADGQYLRRERKFGGFSRSVKVPRAVKADQSQADFKDGVLTITLPKEELQDPKVINVRPLGI